MFFDDTILSSSSLVCDTLSSSISDLGKIEEIMIWDSGCLLWMRSITFCAAVVISLFESKCSKSFVPACRIHNFGEKNSCFQLFLLL